jgi:hypothetical protein
LKALSYAANWQSCYPDASATPPIFFRRQLALMPE